MKIQIFTHSNPANFQISSSRNIFRKRRNYQSSRETNASEMEGQRSTAYGSCRWIETTIEIDRGAQVGRTNTALIVEQRGRERRGRARVAARPSPMTLYYSSVGHLDQAQIRLVQRSKLCCIHRKSFFIILVPFFVFFYL